MLGVFAVGQTLESFVLTPWLVGDRIGLHPVAVIFAIMAGGQLFGFLGVLLALPVAAVAMVMLRYAHEKYTHSHLYGAEPVAADSAIGRSRAGRPCAAECCRAHAPARRVSPQIPLALRFPPDRSSRPSRGRPSSARWSKPLPAALETTGSTWPDRAAAARRICNWRHAPRPAAAGMSASYLPLASMAGRMRDALVGQGGAELVCLDGLEAIAGNAEDEVALFHFHNRAREGTARLIYSAVAMPSALAVRRCLTWFRGLNNARGSRWSRSMKTAAATCCACAPRVAGSNWTMPCSTICSAASAVTSGP